MPSFVAINRLPLFCVNRPQGSSPAEIKSKMSVSNLLQQYQVDENVLEAASMLVSINHLDLSKDNNGVTTQLLHHNKPINRASSSSSSRTSLINSKVEISDVPFESSSATTSPGVKKPKYKRNSSEYHPDKSHGKRCYNSPTYRFVRNMSFWLKDSTINGCDTPTWNWRMIEEKAGKLLPTSNKYLRIPADTDLKKTLETLLKNLPAAVQESQEHKDAGVGLHEKEREVCKLIRLPHYKYRFIRASLIVGFACIYEQNHRGLSQSVCKHHPFMASGQYVPINTGATQAQCIVPKVDTNISAGIFRVFQAWGWFPKSLEVGADGQEQLIRNINEKYPKGLREALIKDYGTWEKEVINMPESRMTIGCAEWFVYSSARNMVDHRYPDCLCEPQSSTLDSSPASKRRKLSG